MVICVTSRRLFQIFLFAVKSQRQEWDKTPSWDPLRKCFLTSHIGWIRCSKKETSRRYQVAHPLLPDCFRASWNTSVSMSTKGQQSRLPSGRPFRCRWGKFSTARPTWASLPVPAFYSAKSSAGLAAVQRRLRHWSRSSDSGGNWSFPVLNNFEKTKK